jgi:tellurite resistance-related uncharacterized protein
MQTTIVGFHQDEQGDWVAELACEHGQHMRHRPPWQTRPWVSSAEGRASKLGEKIECPLCDRITLPAAATEYKRTETFTHETLPAGLRTEHRTKAGTWARIVVEQGELIYQTRGGSRNLRAGDFAVAEPERVHRVEPVGELRMHVEFWREPPPE